MTNDYSLLFPLDFILFLFEVSISPEVTSKKVSREVIIQLVKSNQDLHLGKRKLAYDGRKSCYSVGPLPFTSKEFVEKDESSRSLSVRLFRLISKKFDLSEDVYFSVGISIIFSRLMLLTLYVQDYEPILVSDYVCKYFNRDISQPLTDQERVKVFSCCVHIFKLPLIYSS